MKTKVPVLIITFVCALFFLPFLIKPEILTHRDNDLGRTYMPFFFFIKNTFQHYNQIPLWRPDQMMGETFIGNPLFSVIYPLNILFIIFPVNYGTIIYLFFHSLIALFSTYLLAKSFNYSKLESIANGILYTFSLKLLLHLTAGHITMIAAYSYFPLVFFSIRTFFIKQEFIYLVLGSFSLAAMYITYPSIFYFTVIFVIYYSIYYVCKIYLHKKFSFHRSLRIVALPIFCVMTAIFISASVFFPHLEFAPLSTRSFLKIEDIAVPIWNQKKFFLSVFFPYKIFTDLDHESLLYMGLVPMTLGTIGFFALSNFKKIFVSVGMLFSLIFILGTSTPFFSLFYDYLPFLKYSRVTTRPYFIIILITSLLSVYALKRLKSKKLLFLSLAIFLIESLFIFQHKLKQIPYLNFQLVEIYEYLSRDKSLFRVYCTTYCFNPQLLSKYQVDMFSGETPIQEKSFVEFHQEAGGYKYSNFAVIFPPYQVWQNSNPPQPNPSLLGRANVKYVASTYPLFSFDFNYLEKFNNIYLYKNLKFRERSYFENDISTVRITKYSPNEIKTEFEQAPYDRNLVFSENYYPGWKAFSNHNQLLITKTDQVFRKIAVPAFNTGVDLKYQPESFQMGKTVSLGTMAFILLYIIKRKWKNKSK